MRDISSALEWRFPADIARPCFDRSYARQGRLVSGENRCAAFPRPLPFCDVNFAGEVDRRGVDCRHVHQPAARIVGWRPPVRGAAHCRRHERTLAARFRLGADDRVAVGRESRRPGLFGERPGEKKLSRLPVDRIEKPVAIRPQERGPRLSLPRDFREYRLLYCIPIVLIPGRELVVPSELPGAAIQGHHAVREEVGASAFLALEGRRRVADAPVQKVQIRVVCPGSPRRRSAGLPGIAGPGIVPGLPGARHGIELPQKPSVARSVCCDEPADTELSACDPHYDAITQSERSPRHRIAVAKIRDPGLPFLASR